MKQIAILSLLLACSQEKRGPDLCQIWSHGACPDKKGPVRLTHAPMNLDDVATILPYGLMVGAHVTPIDHGYFAPKDLKAGRTRYDVFAVADGTIVHIQRRMKAVVDAGEKDRETDEYRLVIAHSCTFWTYYDLITQLDKSITDVTGEIKDMKPVLCKIPVKGGQLIGKVGGQTLDFAAVDKEKTLKGLVVPEHYDREPWKIHTVDFFDCYDEPLKSKLLALNPRKAEPRGGRIDYDVDGKLVGNWFLEKTNGYGGAGDKRGYWTGHLSIVPHAMDPSIVMVSHGDWNGKSVQFAVKGSAPDPATVGVKEGLVKYELTWAPMMSDGRKSEVAQRVQGVVLFQVLEGRRLKVEAFPGKTGDDVKEFTAAAKIYER